MLQHMSTGLERGRGVDGILEPDRDKNADQSMQQNPSPEERYEHVVRARHNY